MDRLRRINRLAGSLLDIPENEWSVFLEKSPSDDADIAADAIDLARAAKGIPESAGLALYLEPGLTLKAGDSVDQYRIVKRIGQGGMGVVFEARDTRTDAAVAIKVISSALVGADFSRRFRLERHALSRIRHPNIVSFLGGGVTSLGQPYYAMEFVNGVPLDEFCRSASLSIEQRLQLFLTICEAVGAAHAQLIVHRDLKPGNILVDAAGNPRILDFGLAKMLEAGDDPASFIRTRIDNLIVGSWQYASPEQLSGEPVTTASDVYSLGVLLFELMTGEPPYRIAGRREVESFINSFVITPPSQLVTGRSVSPEARRLRGDLDAIVMRTLRKGDEAALRYQTVDRLAEDIRRHLRGEVLDPATRFSSTRERLKRAVRRHRSAFAAASLIFVTLAGGLGATLYQKKRSDFALERLTRQTVAGLLDETSIAQLPGATEVRRQLLDRIVDDLLFLQREGRADVEVLARVAEAYTKRGDLLGRANTANVGNVAAALTSYQTANSVWLQLARVPVTSQRAQLGLASTFSRIGSAQATMGDHASAASSSAEALRIDEALFLADPGNPSRKRGFSVSLTQVAELKIELGHTDEAIALLQRSLQLDEQLAAAQPGDWRSRRDVAIGFSKIGSILLARGQTSESSSYFRRSLEIRLKLAGEFPNNAQAQRDLVVAYSKEAEVQTAAADFEGAIQNIRQMLRISEAAAEADPKNVLPKRDIAGAAVMLADLLRSTGRIDKAHREYRRAWLIREELASADKSDSRMQEQLAISLERVARSDADLGDAAESRVHSIEALRIRGELATQDTASSRKQRDLSLALGLAGDIAVQFAKPSEALFAYTRALAIHTSLAATQSGDRAIRAELARIKAAVARLDPMKAADLSTGAIAAWASLADTASAQVLTEYASALLTAKPDRLRDSRKALLLAKRAAEMTRWSAPETLVTVALALAASGDMAGAMDARDKTMAVLRPSDAFWGRRLRLQLERIRRGGVLAIE